jgi:hypothetical protein
MPLVAAKPSSHLPLDTFALGRIAKVCASCQQRRNDETARNLRSDTSKEIHQIILAHPSVDKKAPVNLLRCFVCHGSELVATAS